MSLWLLIFSLLLLLCGGSVDDYELMTVVVITRHGDRTQITRSLGPSYGDNEEISNYWKRVLPSNSTLIKMASMVLSETKLNDITNNQMLGHLLYQGWDHIHWPYGQLTQLGSLQLQRVGKELSKKYKTWLLQSDTIYCRTSNFCRTIQSLLSLLMGFYDGDNNNNNPIKTIYARRRVDETIFPYADGPCHRMGERRAYLIASGYNNASSTYEFAKDLESKFKRVLGFRDKITWWNWLNIMEILICYEVHKLQLPEGITKDDVLSVKRYVEWMWSNLYRDRDLVRLALGRFIYELVDDMSLSINFPIHQHRNQTVHESKQGVNTTRLTSYSRNININRSTKMLIYSAHDATLVPILKVLGYPSDEWPEYAAYITIEISKSKRNEKHYAKVLYNQKEFVVPGCASVWCPVETVFQLLEYYSISPGDYKIECRNYENNVTSVAKV
jgi:hypothetical protein